MIPLKYNYSSDFSEGLAVVQLDGLWGMINQYGTEIIPLIYDKIYPFRDGLALAVKDGKYGYININNEFQFQYLDYLNDTDITSFSSGLAKIILNDKKTFINRMGKIYNSEPLKLKPIYNDTIKDLDSNEYKTLIFDENTWTAKNLNVSRFNNGDYIPQVFNDKQWVLACKNKKPAWCYYKFKENNKDLYGKYYNWFAISDQRGIAPKGWRIPNIEDWRNLMNKLTFIEDGVYKIKSKKNWKKEFCGSDEFEFDARPSGIINEYGFKSSGNLATWWSANASDLIPVILKNAKSIVWSYNYSEINEFDIFTGIPIRCIKNKLDFGDEMIESISVYETKTKNDTNFDLDVALDIYFSGKFYDGEDNRFRLLYEDQIENEKLGAFKEEHILKHNIDIIYSNILVPYRKGKLWGLSDIKKNIILNCDYDEILFHESGFKVKKNSTWKYLNKSDILINNFQNDQKLKIEPLKKSEKDFFDCILKSSEGLSAVRIGKVHQGKWGFVDLQNNIIVPIIYDAVEDFSEGLSAVRIGYKCGFVNNKGTPITELIYDYLDYGPDGYVLGVTSFKNGYAGVCINKKWGFIDRNGRTVVNNLYNEIRQFSDGLAAVEKQINNDTYRWGFVNEHGVEVIQCIYSEVGDFQNGLAPVTSYNKDEKDVMRIFKMGFINKNGDIVIPFIYDKLKPFCEGIAVAKLPSLLTREEISDVSWGRKSPNISKMSRTGFIDKNGTTVIPFEYIDADDFSEGIAMVRKKPGRWCYIDKNNHEVFSQDFHNANPFKNGFAKVQKLGFDWGYIDINGNEFWEDSIEQIREAIDVALSMNYLIQFKYQKLTVFNKGEFSLRTIKPYTFEQIGQSLCVKGYCYLRAADITFSLERITELIIDPEYIQF